MSKTGFTLWVDADACPVAIKNILFRVAQKRGLNMVLVANSNMHIPAADNISLQLVPGGSDMADNYIAENCQPGDLVITADIPLADRVVKAGATGLNPRGEMYTEENISSILSMRDFMEEMRFAGEAQGGPRSHARGDNAAFANSLDRFIVGQLRKSD